MLKRAAVGHRRQLAGLLAVLLVVAASISGTAIAAESGDLVEAGRRIYEDGVLPDGEPLIATRPEGLRLQGARAACTTCHRRSGMGSVEGTGEYAILVPPLAGPVLFAPAPWVDNYLDEAHHYVPHPSWTRAMKRPAYDRTVLDTALREGTNSAGELIGAPMPLYALDPNALDALAAYLHQLTSQADPGVEADAVHFATVVTPDADPADADAVQSVLEAWSETSMAAGIPWRLHVWRLTGAVDGWREQLDRLYADRPVFALISGAGAVEWGPVNAFCETERVPCLMPSLDAAPRNADRGEYAIFFSPGVALEARILARHFDSLGDAPARLVQVYADAAGRQGAETLRAELGHLDYDVVTRRLSVTAPAMALDGIESDETLVLWLSPWQLRALTAATPIGPEGGNVYLSATMATPELVSLPQGWRARARFATLFDDFGVHAEIARLRLQRWLDERGLTKAGLDPRVQADAFVAAYLLHRAMGQMRQQESRRVPVPMTRDHLLETIEDLAGKYDDGSGLIDLDSHVAYYGRMSLGPGQRTAVRGGTIARYESEVSDRLVAAGERIVPD